MSALQNTPKEDIAQILKENKVFACLKNLNFLTGGPDYEGVSVEGADQVFG